MIGLSSTLVSTVGHSSILAFAWAPSQSLGRRMWLQTTPAAAAAAVTAATAAAAVPTRRLADQEVIELGSPDPSQPPDAASLALMRSSLRRLIPEMTEADHKGSQGRVAVLGGSPDYTGAPYFAAMAALRVGADLSYVLTAAQAAPAIKGYSPELMVTPVYDAEWPGGKEQAVQQMVGKVGDLLPKLHSLVIGPGLGRDETVFKAVEKVVQLARERSLPLVFDADALFLLSKRPDIVSGYEKAVLTPNIVEFQRLWGAFETRKSEGSPSDVKELSSLLGNVIIVLKGGNDVISDGRKVLVNTSPGGLKRCGGLGDVLSGSMATTLAWAAIQRQAAAAAAAAQGGEGEQEERDDMMLWAAFWACGMVKQATWGAFYIGQADEEHSSSSSSSRGRRDEGGQCQAQAQVQGHAQSVYSLPRSEQSGRRRSMSAVHALEWLPRVVREMEVGLFGAEGRAEEDEA